MPFSQNHELMNIVDKLVSFFDPNAGLKRVQKRMAIENIERGFEAARRDRRTNGWGTNEEGYNDSRTLSEITTLRDRSRNLFKNNPYAFRAHNSIVNNSIGIGILPAITNEKLKKVWAGWADKLSCDFDGLNNFYGLQSLVMKTMSVHGEVLILRCTRKDKKGQVPIELKVLAPVFLDSSKFDVRGGKIIKGGIEFDQYGKRIGYWIFNTNPADESKSESKFWKESDVIHLFQVDEPGQIRGIPWGTPSMMSLRDFDDYADAQLMRQKVAACFSVFITEPSDGGGLLSGANNDDNLEKVSPGIIEHLAPGKQVTFAAPPAAEGYSEYSRNVLTSVAVGYGTTYEAMSGDLSNVNFSSGRMGWIEFGRNIEVWQWNIIIPRFCDVVWKWFLDGAIIGGLLPKSTPDVITWTAPRRQMIDPVKEVKGLVDQVRAGLMSWQEAVRSLGFTPEEVLAEMISAKKLFDESGLAPYVDPRFDKQQFGPEIKAEKEEID